MTLNYEELNEKFKARQKRERDYIDKCTSFAFGVAESVRDLIDAPEKFEVREANSKYNKPYVGLMASDEDGAATAVRFQPDAVQIDSDGTVRFAVYVTFEQSPNAYPKRTLPVPLWCRLNSSEIEVRFRHTKKTFNNDEKEHSQLFCAKEVIAEVERYLDATQDEFFTNKTIGFDVSKG
ncbi:MAG: hypothetical protein RIA08_10850 [Roseovarius sp.]|uniref:hypothetical protein n=1 Tax=Roseovarius sp. TaxID=1486281 RepID=UPI0032F08960